MKRTITLALETGVYGGSICLLRNGEEVSSWIGESEKTKSEEFLGAIKKVFYGSRISVGEISEIVISQGPGSYNGLRVGLSIAKGLKTALDIKIRYVKVLDEMMIESRLITVAALPFGKTEVCWKIEGNGRVDSSSVQNTINYTSKIDFPKMIAQLKPDILVLPANLYNELAVCISFLRDNIRITHCDKNLACLIGKSNQDLNYDEEIKILYPKPFKIG